LEVRQPAPGDAGEDAALSWVSEKSPHNGLSRRLYAAEFSYGCGVELGYARVSTVKQDLERQIDAAPKCKPPLADLRISAMYAAELADRGF